jgi:hypothetical protein
VARPQSDYGFRYNDDRLVRTNGQARAQHSQKGGSKTLGAHTRV